MLTWNEEALLDDCADSLPQPTLLMLLRAYFDESGTHAQSKIITMAGWVIRRDRLKLFTRDWHRVLARFGVNEAKAADLEARKGEFKGWSNVRVQEFRIALSDTIDHRTSYGIAISVVVPDYERVIAASLPPRDPMRDPYLWVMQACLESAYKSKYVRASDRISCTFDAGHRRQGLAERYFYRLTLGEGPIARAGRILPSWRTADSRSVMGLQAADLLAYGSRRGTDWNRRGLTPGYVETYGIVKAKGVQRARVSGGFFSESELRIAKQQSDARRR